jgi:hypothetical protein
VDSGPGRPRGLLPIEVAVLVHGMRMVDGALEGVRRRRATQGGSPPRTGSRLSTVAVSGTQAARGFRWSDHTLSFHEPVPEYVHLAIALRKESPPEKESIARKSGRISGTAQIAAKICSKPLRFGR